MQQHALLAENQTLRDQLAERFGMGAASTFGFLVCLWALAALD